MEDWLWNSGKRLTGEIHFMMSGSGCRSLVDLNSASHQVSSEGLVALNPEATPERLQMFVESWD
jgi:hypothetical protein